MGKLNQKAEQRRIRKEVRRAKKNGRPDGIPGGTPNGKGGIQISHGVDYYPAQKAPTPTAPITPAQPTQAPKPANLQPQRQKLIYAAGDDWAGLAKFYVGLNPHVPFPQVEKEGGIIDLFLRFIPGETIRIGVKPAADGAETAVRFLQGYKTRGQIPQEWKPLSQTPPWFQYAWKERKEICEKLDGDLTPWTEETATALIKGEAKPTTLRIYYQTLRHKMPNGRIVQAPFGIAISINPEKKEATYVKVFDLQNQFGVKERDSFPISWFGQKREDPVLHALYVWAKMEAQCKTKKEKLSFSRPDRQTVNSAQ